MIASYRWSHLLPFVPFVGCSVYDDELIERAGDDDFAYSVTPGDGDGDAGGGTDTGGQPGTGDGDAAGDGGMGAAPSGGTSSASGGASSSGGGDATGGGENGAGGMGSGGHASGGTGAGGSSSADPCEFPSDTTIDLVDDMNLAGNRIVVKNGRMGDWISFHGEHVETTPSPNELGRWPSHPMSERMDDAGNYALNYVSSLTEESPDPGEIWQHFGFLLNEGQTYDLSGFDGLMFCARRGAPGIVSLNLRVLANVDSGTATLETSGAIIPETWGIVKIPFGADWPVETLELAVNLEFVGDAGTEYDIWLDDIALYTVD